MPLLAVLYGLLLLMHGLASVLLFLYSINCYIMLFLHRRSGANMLRSDEAVDKAWQTTATSLPHVTVQLPLYNERYVVQRLIEAVTCLDYPKDRLEIQVLDDSTDGTTAIAADLVTHYRPKGFDIALLHRQHRRGYKAGALQEGLAVAKGTFIAIFDADFVPPATFLRQTLPFFQDPAIAMVQVRWDHINGDYSLLTRAQTFGINGHFWVEQAARCWSGLFMNFNGSGGIWRRQAMEDVGGWQADTLTEDLDLSYRAQLRGWRLKFLPHVVCPAELPVQMSALKSQQYRWAKGSIQTARKLMPQILKARLPLFVKYQACCHLTNYLVHPLMLFVVLNASLLFWFGSGFASQQHVLVAMSLLMATFAPSAMYLYAHAQLYPDWKRRLWAFPFLLMLGTGIALNNTRAIVEALCKVHSPFVRTPKYRIEVAADTWLGKDSRVPFPWLSVGEILLAAYVACGMLLSPHQGRRLIDPFLLLFTMGFASVALCSFWEFWQERVWKQPPPRGRGRSSTEASSMVSLFSDQP